MSRLILFIIVLGLLTGFSSIAQTGIRSAREKWVVTNGKVVFHGDTIHLTNMSEKSAVLWLGNTNFKNGVIELDLKGKDVRGESFLGLVFHAVDADTYDAVYFRPFNFRSMERKDHAVQYIDIPGHDWDVLREKFPGKYENFIEPAPDPNNWFHAKIVIDFPSVKIYVNNAKQPSLQVEQISKRQDGKLGLWIDSKDGWFQNVVVTHRK
jgi:hypothetical protein